MTISFWLHRPPPPAAFAEWDPDREPERFASGAGHNILELAKRLEALGATVQVGEDAVAPGSLLVLFLKDAFSSAPAFRGALRAVQRARGRFVVVRSDAPSDWVFPVRPLREFVPTLRSVEKPWQRWLPPLPQRGLRPRRPDRRGCIRTLALKSNPENVPSAVRTQAWEDALAARGIGWWLDVPARRDGSDQAWHDFAEVDVVLCAPHPDRATDPLRKPATRLVNAWAAGCIPLAVREPAYLELARDGEDALFFEDLAECFEHLDRLRSDPGLLDAVERNVLRRGEEFSAERTSRRWLEALQEAAGTGRASASRHWLRMVGILEKRLAHLAHEAAGTARTGVSRRG